MAKPKKYKTISGGHVRISRQAAATRPIDVPAEGDYETEDPQEQEALSASSEVSEVKPDRKAKAPEVEADEQSEGPPSGRSVHNDD